METELKLLCPSIKRENYRQAVNRMVEAYKLNGFSVPRGAKQDLTTGERYAVLYLKHLAQVEKETLAKFTIGETK